MNDNVVTHLIQGCRAQMKALDILLEALDRRLAEPVIDNTLRCPSCSIELAAGNQYMAMGQTQPFYACPNCDFRGPV